MQRSIAVFLLVLAGSAYADDVTGTFVVDGHSNTAYFPFGVGSVILSGTFDGATISLQRRLADEVTWLTDTDTEKIASDQYVVTCGTRCYVRLLCEDDGAGTSVEFEISPMPTEELPE